MRIGVDFDNTIVCYDQLFRRAAMARALIPEGVSVAKEQVRDYLRQHGREDAWTELQGHIYGALMHEAPAFPGALEFLARCHRRGIAVCIISHRTRTPLLGEAYDLHAAAHRWLKRHGVYDQAGIGLSPAQVHFELTKQDKLARIVHVGCTHFIDDLPEFLCEPGFPLGVERILFDPNGNCPASGPVHRAGSWGEIGRLIFSVRAAG